MTYDDDPLEKPAESWFAPGRNNVLLVYVLYLASFVFGLTIIVGLVFAYVNRGKAPLWLQTHYTYLIRTFWIGLLYSLISLVLMMVAIGFLLGLAVAIWVIVRCVLGLQKVSRSEPVGNPESWLN